MYSIQRGLRINLNKCLQALHPDVEPMRQPEKKFLSRRNPLAFVYVMCVARCNLFDPIEFDIDAKREKHF